MVLKSLLAILSGVLGNLLAIIWTQNILIPMYPHPHVTENLTGEFLLIQFLLCISFASIFYFLFLEVWGIAKKKKKFSVFGVILPLSYSGLFLLEKMVITGHHYSDIWVIIVGGIVIAILLGMFLLVIFDEIYLPIKPDREDEEDILLTISTPVSFHATEMLTKHIHIVTNLIEKSKTLEIEVETVHEVEKMERQLKESKAIYMHVSEKHQNEAEKTLMNILSKMESRLLEILDEYDQQQLTALEKIFIQQQ